MSRQAVLKEREQAANGHERRARKGFVTGLMFMCERKTPPLLLEVSSNLKDTFFLELPFVFNKNFGHQGHYFSVMFNCFFKCYPHKMLLKKLYLATPSCGTKIELDKSIAKP